MIYLFDKDEKLIKLIRSNAVKSAIQTQTLTDTNYVSDRLTVETKELPESLLSQVTYIAIPTREDHRKFHFYFSATQTTDESTVFEGTQAGIEELRKSWVKDMRPTNMLAKSVVDSLLSGTNWTARYVADVGINSTNLYYTSVFESLQKVCAVWGLEMQFFVEMSNNTIGARYIDFKQKIGKSVGKRAVYGHNALKIIQESEKTDLITAVIGRGKSIQVSSAEETGNQSDGYSRKISFADIESNAPLKPKGQEYVEYANATNLYGIKTPSGMKPKFGFFEYDTDDKNVLLQKSWEYLLENSHPKTTFKTTTAYLSDAEIGDTIRVVKPKRDLDYSTRIYEVSRDRLTDKANVVLGDRLNVSEARKTQNLTSSIANAVGGSLFQSVTGYFASAGGFNTNWYTDTTPPVGKVKIGDIWYKPDPEFEGEFIMMTWDGQNWIEIVRTHDFNQMVTDKVELEKAIADSTAKADAQATAIRKEVADNKIIADAEFATIKQVADATTLELQNDITSQIETAKTTINSDIQKVITDTDSKIASSQETLSAKISAETDPLKVQLADLKTDLSATNLSLVDTTAIANDSLTKAKQALVDSAANTTKLIDTEQTLSNTVSQLSAVKITADNALSGVSTVQTKVNGFQATVDGLTQTITTKADKTTVDGISQTVTSQGLRITQAIDGLTTKADKSTVDNLSNTVNTQATLISQNADAIKLKANSADLNTLTNRVTTAESSIVQTAAAIRTELSTVDAKIPTAVGGRNYVLRSDFSITSGERLLTMSADFVAMINARRTITLSVTANGSNITSSQKPIFEISLNLTDGTTQVVQLYSDTPLNYNPRLGKTYTLPAGKYVSSIASARAYFSNSVSYPVLKQPKIEADGLRTDWTPAPEDIVGDVSTLTTTVTQTSTGVTQLSTKVTALENTTTTQQASIKALNDQIVTKVSQTDYNALTARVTTAETSIIQTSNAVATKASKVDFDTLTGRVSTTETTLVTQAGQISQRLTATQVDSAITAKGYQTKADVDSNITGRSLVTTTVLNNQLKETVNGYTREISRVEGLIPTSAGGRNYVLNSNVSITTGSKDLSLSSDFVTTINTQRTMTLSVTVNGSDVNSTQRPIFRITLNFTDSSSETIELTSSTPLNYYPRISKVYTLPIGKNVSSVSSAQLIFMNSVSYALLKQPKIEMGSLRGDWTAAIEDQATVIQLNSVISTATENTQAISSLQNDTLKKAEVSITDNQITLGVGKTVNGTTMASMIALTDSSVKIIADKMKVTGDMIVDGTITASDIAANSITTAKLNALAVTADKLAVNAVTADKIQAGAIVADKLAVNSVTTSAIASNSITTAMIQAGAVTANSIAVDAVTTNAIQAGAIIAGKVATNAITADNIQASAITAGKIASGAVTTVALSAEAVTADKLKVDSALINKLTVDNVLASQIIAKDVFAAGVKAVSIDVNTLTGNKSTFLQSLWQATNSSVRVDGNGLYTTRSDGSVSSYVTTDGLQVWGAGEWTGTVSYTTGGSYGGGGGVAFASRNKRNIYLGHHGSSTNDFTPSIVINGQTGNIAVPGKLIGTQAAGINEVNGLSIGRTQVYGKWASYWIGENMGAGIYFCDDGTLYLKGKKGYTEF